MSESELVRWSEALAAIARTGLGFTENVYERERFEEILAVAADIATHINSPAREHVESWLEGVAPGVAGYVTAKTAVGAIVGNEQGELLLIKRTDNHQWFIPTGWADVGYSLSEVVIKEVAEEVGLLVEPMRIVGIVDGLRAGAPHAFHSTLFACKLLGGELKIHPLECEDAGWFAEGELPEPLIQRGSWQDIAFAAIRGEIIQPFFDPPRDYVWREDLQ